MMMQSLRGVLCIASLLYAAGVFPYRKSHGGECLPGALRLALHPPTHSRYKRGDKRYRVGKSLGHDNE